MSERTQAQGNEEARNPQSLRAHTDLLVLAQKLYSSIDPDHCEFCGRYIGDETADLDPETCPAREEARRCRP